MILKQKWGNWNLLLQKSTEFDVLGHWELATLNKKYFKQVLHMYF